MESSLTVCEEKIPVREEEPCRVECGSKVPVWARDFSQKNFTEGVRHEVTEWGDFYLSLEIFEWQITISCYCFDEEWKIRKMLQEKPYVIFRLYEWLSRPFQHVATRGWCSCDKWVASWDRHGAEITCYILSAYRYWPFSCWNKGKSGDSGWGRRASNEEGPAGGNRGLPGVAAMCHCYGRTW